MKSGIYKIENIINHKIYIGSAANIKLRWSSHKSNLKNNIHENKHLQKSYNKYGEINFSFSILEFVKKENLIIQEQFWYNFYKNNGFTFYNFNDIVENPMKGKTHTIETKNKISKINKGRKWSEETRMKMKSRVPWNKGKTGIYSNEVKIKIANSLKGKKLSKETKEKLKGRTPWNKGKKLPPISEWHRQRVIEANTGINNHFFGKHHSEETKKKISEHHKKLKNCSGCYGDRVISS